MSAFRLSWSFPLRVKFRLVRSLSRQSVAKLVKHCAEFWNLLHELRTRAKKICRLLNLPPPPESMLITPSGTMVFLTCPTLCRGRGGMFYLVLGYSKFCQKTFCVSSVLQPIVDKHGGDRETESEKPPLLYTTSLIVHKTAGVLASRIFLLDHVQDRAQQKTHQTSSENNGRTRRVFSQLNCCVLCVFWSYVWTKTLGWLTLNQTDVILLIPWHLLSLLSPLSWSSLLFCRSLPRTAILNGRRL